MKFFFSASLESAVISGNSDKTKDKNWRAVRNVVISSRDGSWRELDSIIRWTSIISWLVNNWSSSSPTASWTERVTTPIPPRSPWTSSSTGLAVGIVKKNWTWGRMQSWRRKRVPGVSGKRENTFSVKICPLFVERWISHCKNYIRPKSAESTCWGTATFYGRDHRKKSPIAAANHLESLVGPTLSALLTSFDRKRSRMR